MLTVSGSTPTPLGHEWKFYCSVGVDCSDAEPRCIWMAVLRCFSPSASPRRIPITSTQRWGSQRHVKHHRSTLVRGKTFRKAFNHSVCVYCCQSIILAQSKLNKNIFFIFLCLKLWNFDSSNRIHKYVPCIFLNGKYTYTVKSIYKTQEINSSTLLIRLMWKHMLSREHLWIFLLKIDWL